MTTRHDAATAAPWLKTREDWLVSHSKGFRANIIVWGMPKDLPTFEIRAKLADLGLDSKGLTKELVIQVSASLRKIGCRCVLDDAKSGVRFMPMECFN